MGDPRVLAAGVEFDALVDERLSRAASLSKRQTAVEKHAAESQ
jgi:hypothetical protein